MFYQKRKKLALDRLDVLLHLWIRTHSSKERHSSKRRHSIKRRSHLIDLMSFCTCGLHRFFFVDQISWMRFRWIPHTHGFRVFFLPFCYKCMCILLLEDQIDTSHSLTRICSLTNAHSLTRMCSLTIMCFLTKNCSLYQNVFSYTCKRTVRKRILVGEHTYTHTYTHIFTHIYTHIHVQKDREETHSSKRTHLISFGTSITSSTQFRVQGLGFRSPQRPQSDRGPSVKRCTSARRASCWSASHWGMSGALRAEGRAHPPHRMPGRYSQHSVLQYLSYRFFFFGRRKAE